jgi:CheY-like chemotaxis protein
MTKILLADDEPGIRTVLRRLLEATAPCEVLEAGDGQTAVALARAEHPRVVVLDLDMPGLTGYEVCLQLQSDPATRDIAVFILTGCPDADVQGYAFLPVAGYFEKPLGVPALCRAVVERLGAS